MLLVVVAVGSLSFIYWQNYVQPRPVVQIYKTNAGSPATKPATDTADTTTNNGYLVLDDWGVKFKLPASLGDNQITYHKGMRSGAGDEYDFSTSRVEALGGSCVQNDQSYVPLGTITRATAPSTALASPPELAGKFGGYYYYYHHPQAGCADSGTDVQIQDVNIIQTMLMSVEKS